MLKIKKLLTFRLISFIIIGIFLFADSAYPSDTLRIPVGTSKRTEEIMDALGKAKEYTRLEKEGRFDSGARKRSMDLGRELAEKTRIVVLDIDGTLREEGKDISEGPALEPLLSLLRLGIPVYIITANSLENAMESVIDHIDVDLRHPITVYSARGIRVTGFLKDGRILDRPYLVNRNYMIGSDEYPIVKSTVDNLIPIWRKRIEEDENLRQQFPGFYEGYYIDEEGNRVEEERSRYEKGLRIDHINDIPGLPVLGIIDLLIADIPSSKYAVDGKRDLRLEFIEELKRSLPPYIVEQLDIGPTYSASILICRRGANKGVAISSILKQEKIEPSEILYFGDKFHQGGQDMPILDAGVNCVAVDIDQTKVDARAIKSGGGIEATAGWINFLVQAIGKKGVSAREVSEDILYENLMRQFWKNFAEGLKGGFRTEDSEFLNSWRDPSGRDILKHVAAYNLSIPHESSLWRQLVSFQQEVFNALPSDLQEKITLFGPEGFHITVGIPLRPIDHPYSEDEIQSMVESLDKVASEVKAAEFDIQGLNGFPGGILFAQALPVFEGEREFEFDEFERALVEKSSLALHYDSNAYHITLGFITGELTPEESERLVEVLSKFRSQSIGRFRAKEMELNYFNNFLSPDRTLKTYTLASNQGVKKIEKTVTLPLKSDWEDWSEQHPLDKAKSKVVDEGVARFHKSGSLKELEPLVHHSDPYIRDITFMHIGNALISNAPQSLITSVQFAQWLVEALYDPDQSVVIGVTRVINLLSQTSSPEVNRFLLENAVEPLLQFLDRRVWNPTFDDAMEALSHFGDKRVVRPLLQFAATTPTVPYFAVDERDVAILDSKKHIVQLAMASLDRLLKRGVITFEDLQVEAATFGLQAELIRRFSFPEFLEHELGCREHLDVIDLGARDGAWGSRLKAMLEAQGIRMTVWSIDIDPYPPNDIVLKMSARETVSHFGPGSMDLVTFHAPHPPMSDLYSSMRRYLDVAQEFTAVAKELVRIDGRIIVRLANEDKARTSLAEFYQILKEPMTTAEGETISYDVIQLPYQPAGIDKKTYDGERWYQTPFIVRPILAVPKEIKASEPTLASEQGKEIAPVNETLESIAPNNQL